MNVAMATPPTKRPAVINAGRGVGGAAAGRRRRADVSVFHPRPRHVSAGKTPWSEGRVERRGAITGQKCEDRRVEAGLGALMRRSAQHVVVVARW